MPFFSYQVKLQDDEVYIVNVRCNGAATILMAETGALYAYGENNENRLGLGNMFEASIKMNPLEGYQEILDLRHKR